MARLRAGENIVIFRTQRYDMVPLTIAGPGAGPEVTAAGILAEVLDSLGYINAHASSKASRGLRGWSVVESP